MRLMFNGKEYSPSQPLAGDGLSKNGGTLNVDNPNRGILTQAEFSALTEEQKASGTYLVDDGQGGSSGWETYSTEERRIGTWIDGKPVYRKVISGTVSSGLILLTSVSKVVSIDGVLYGGNYVYHYPVFYYIDASSMLIYHLSDSNLTMMSSANNVGANFDIIIKYTKTTDQGVGA